VSMTAEALPQEIRRHVGNHALGTDDLATALLPFIERHIAERVGNLAQAWAGVTLTLSEVAPGWMNHPVGKEWDAPSAAVEAIRHIAAGQQGAMSAWVGDMKTSAGMDYYVCVGHGKDCGEHMTPNVYKIRGRAEYDVACWNHLFGLCEAPDILAFDTDEPTATPQPPKPADSDLRAAFDDLVCTVDAVANSGDYVLSDPAAYALQGALEDAKRVPEAKPAGAVPLPECDVDVVTLAGVRVLAYTPDGLREYGDAREAAARSAGRADAVPGGWSGWATQYPDKLPKLFGALEIAELNHYPEEGARLIYLIEATPLPRQPAAEDNLQWALDQGGILADWCNQAGNALKALMAAYERKIRTDCALADLESKPWRCAEYVQAEEAMRAKPAPTVNFEPAAVNQQIKVVGYRWRNSDHHPWTLGEAVSGFDLNSREIGAVIEPLGVINQQMTTQGERDIELADAEALERAANLTCSSLRGTVNEPGLTIWKFNRSALANFVREITGGQADA